MESTMIITPAKAVFCFPSEHNTLKDQHMKKNQYFIDAQGEVLPTQRGTTKAEHCDLLII